MKKQIAVLFIFFLPGLASYSQSLNTAKLDSLFTSLSANDLAMGSIAISVNGIIKYQRAVGSALIDGDKKIPADLHTKYRIGSVSKMFTAVMIFQLMEEGKITADQYVSTYFPGLPNAHKITIANLLYHRSGLHNYSEGTNFQDWMDKPRTHEELLQIITDKGPDFEPGAKAEYSNTNYLLLSYIIEKVSSMSYKEALQKRIISRIGLQETYYGKPSDIQKNESTSYTFFNTAWTREKETDMSIHSGAGAIVSTPRDLALFMNALFSYKLVSAASLAKMETFIDGYGMGMFPFPHGSAKGYGHNGKIESFAASLQYFPAAKLAVAYCTNGQVYAKDDILQGVISICLNEPYIVPLFKPIASDAKELDKYLGKYVSAEPPLTVNCSRDSTGLLLETGGHSMAVHHIGKDYFMQPQMGFFFEFNPQDGTLMIKESDKVYYLKKEK